MTSLTARLATRKRRNNLSGWFLIAALIMLSVFALLIGHAARVVQYTH